MTTVLAIVAPVFALILLGFVAAKAGLFNDAAVGGLVGFVFNFAIPALLFRSLAQTTLPPQIEWGFLLSYYAVTLLVYGLGVGAGRVLFKRPLQDQAIFGMSAGFSNTVLLGIPILITVFGAEASLPIFLLIGLHGPTLMSLTVVLIQMGRGRTESTGRRLRAVATELVKNPIILGLAAGLATNLSGLTLPGPVDTAAAMLGAAAIPCSLFTMGASLAAYPLLGDVRAALVLGFLKLAVHPLLVWVVAAPVMGLDGIWVQVAVIMAAMPSGINVYLFAARYDAASGVAARAVLLSTLTSIVTISLALLLLRA